MIHLSALIEVHGYWVIGLVILMENAGIPLPGETALLTAGYLSSPAGGEHLHLWAVALVAFVAAVVGDNIGFWLGRRYVRDRLKAGGRFLLLTPARLQIAERYFDKYGVLTVFMARFIAVLRIVCGPAAGASQMPWPRFLIANAAGALCWAVVVSVSGHAAGHAWKALRNWLGHGAWAVLAFILLALLIGRLFSWLTQRKKRII